MKFSYPNQENNYSASLPSLNLTKMEKKNSFLKKQSERVVENKGKWQKTNRKQTENKPETKRAMLLKTQKASNKQSENKPKNKAKHVNENKGSKKTDRKQAEESGHEIIATQSRLSSLLLNASSPPREVAGATVRRIR